MSLSNLHFIMMVKSAQPGEGGGGVQNHPLSLYLPSQAKLWCLPSHTKLWCKLQLRGRGGHRHLQIGRMLDIDLIPDFRSTGVKGSVADPDPNADTDPNLDPDTPDPHVFGPPGFGSRSISQRYGSGFGSRSESFYH